MPVRLLRPSVFLLLAAIASVPCASLAVPRIVPVDLPTARGWVQEWAREARRARRDGRVHVAMPLERELTASVRAYATNATDSLGVIAVVSHDAPNAVALLERVTGAKLVVWDVSCAPGTTAGTALMRTLREVVGVDDVRMARTVHPRWRLAFAYAGTDSARGAHFEASPHEGASSSSFLADADATDATDGAVTKDAAERAETIVDEQADA